jgi:hypothetical protein
MAAEVQEQRIFDVVLPDVRRVVIQRVGAQIFVTLQGGWGGKEDVAVFQAALANEPPPDFSPALERADRLIAKIHDLLEDSNQCPRDQHCCDDDS